MKSSIQAVTAVPSRVVFSHSPVLTWALVFGTLLAVAGCASSRLSVPARILNSSGSMHGGQQPVTGATIQLYAAGSAGDGSAALPLISTTVTTSDGSGNVNSNANLGNAFNMLPAGSFTITGDYQCPSVGAEVYLVGAGGNPGLAAGTNNHALVLMAALGPCGDISSATYISLNELTTVGSIAALANYMNSYAALGSGSSDASQFQTAFSAVSEYTNNALGTVPGVTLPSSSYASSIEIQTLGDILAGCVNSAGGVAGDGGICGQLFTYATPSGGVTPTDIVAAALNIINNPGLNVCLIYNLLDSEPPFQPTLTSCPASWTLPIAALSVSVSGQAAVYAAQAAQYSAIVTGAASQSVTWMVNGVSGGSATTGTISASGLYTAPATAPLSAVTVSAASNLASTAVGSLSLNVLPVAVTVSGPVSVLLAQTAQYSAVVAGSTSQSVSWMVNGVTGGSIATGTISSSGLFTAPTTVSATSETVSATSTATLAVGSLSVMLPPVMAYTGVNPADPGETFPTFSPYFNVSVGGAPLYVYTALVRAYNFNPLYSQFIGGNPVPASVLVPQSSPAAYSPLGGYPYLPNLSGVTNYFGNAATASFASFDLAGTTQVVVTFPSGYPTQTLTSAIVLPAAANITPIISGNTITFTVSPPAIWQQQHLTLEVNGDWMSSLHLSINPIQGDIPNAAKISAGYSWPTGTKAVPNAVNKVPASSNNLYYFGPGEHWITGNLTFSSNAEIYLADGASVKWTGSSNPGPMITLKGSNIYLHGRGIIDAQFFEGVHPTNGDPLQFANSTSSKVDGITIRNSSSWNFPIYSSGTSSSPINVNNINIFGWSGDVGQGGSDGIDIASGSQYVTVSNSFIRTNDDLIVIKQNGTTSTPTNNITVQYNTLWNERAHALSIGAEVYPLTGGAIPINTVTFESCDIIHDTGSQWALGIENQSTGTVQNATWNNIAVENTNSLISIKNAPTSGDIPGIATNILFSNITSVAQTILAKPNIQGNLANIQFLVEIPDGNVVVASIANVTLSNVQVGATWSGGAWACVPTNGCSTVNTATPSNSSSLSPNFAETAILIDHVYTAADVPYYISPLIFQ